MTVVAPTMKHLIAALLVASALALTATRAQELQGALAGGICEKDPELKEISASNPAVAACCTKFDTLLANIDAVLAQGTLTPLGSSPFVSLRLVLSSRSAR